MGDKLQRVFEYRVLLCKESELGIPLTPQESARLARLAEQLPSGVPSVDNRDPHTLLTTPLPSQFIVAGRFGAGIVRNVSGDGLAIVAAEPPQLGERLIVHVREPQHGLEYTFPSRVISRVVKGVTAVGAAFEGMPSQSRLGGRASGVWRSDDTPTEGSGGKNSSSA